MQFAIAMLAVATFLLITGVVGHDTEMGHGGIALKVRGKVGPVPRLVLFIASGVALVLALLSFIAVLPSSGGTPPTPGATWTPSSPVTSQPTEATFTLLVGIRPQLGQFAENMELMLDDQVVATWSADQANPSKTLTVNAPAGTHSYRIQGSYVFYDSAGNLQRRAAAGSGEIIVAEGLHLGVNYLGGDTFELAPLP